MEIWVTVKDVDSSLKIVYTIQMSVIMQPKR